MQQQIATFEELYPHLNENGVYVCEDLQTSYWEEYGGGYRTEGTFIELAKRLVDLLNAWYSREPASLSTDEFTRSTHSLHFYPGVLVIEKRKMQPPRAGASGRPSPEIGS